MRLTRKQEIGLMALRITLGLLLFWWGLAKILNPKMGVGISKKFYFDLASVADIQYAFAWFEMCVGLCVVLGLFRKYVVPMQLTITGVSSLAIWNALLDPFALYLPVDKVAGIQHLFYPSAIALAAGVMLWMMRDFDRFCLDRLIASFRQRPGAIAT